VEELIETEVIAQGKPEVKTVPPPPSGAQPAASTALVPTVENKPAVRPTNALNRMWKGAYNCLIMDEGTGRTMEWIDPEPANTPKTNLGRLRRYGRLMVYFVKRDRLGVITPLEPPQTWGEVTPPELGDALEDPDSAELFTPEHTLLDVLNDFKIPIIVIIEIIAIFILAFTFGGD
jgi:hypothetical protein